MASMFILSAALDRTGAIESIAHLLNRAVGRSDWSMLLVMLPIVALLSAFINNTHRGGRVHARHDFAGGVARTEAFEIPHPVVVRLHTRGNVHAHRNLDEHPRQFPSATAGAGTVRHV